MKITMTSTDDRKPICHTLKEIKAPDQNPYRKYDIIPDPEGLYQLNSQPVIIKENTKNPELTFDARKIQVSEKYRPSFDEIMHILYEEETFWDTIGRDRYPWMCDQRLNEIERIKRLIWTKTGKNIQRDSDSVVHICIPEIQNGAFEKYVVSYHGRRTAEDETIFFKIFVSKNADDAQARINLKTYDAGPDKITKTRCIINDIEPERPIPLFVKERITLYIHIMNTEETNPENHEWDIEYRQADYEDLVQWFIITGKPENVSLHLMKEPNSHNIYMEIYRKNEKTIRKTTKMKGVYGKTMEITLAGIKYKVNIETVI